MPLDKKEAIEDLLQKKKIYYDVENALRLLQAAYVNARNQYIKAQMWKDENGCYLTEDDLKEL